VGKQAEKFASSDSLERFDAWAFNHRYHRRPVDKKYLYHRDCDLPFVIFGGRLFDLRMIYYRIKSARESTNINVRVIKL